MRLLRASGCDRETKFRSRYSMNFGRENNFAMFYACDIEILKLTILVPI